MRANQMLFLNAFQKLVFPTNRMKILVGIIILSLLFLGDRLVEWTGGTAYAYVNILYIPIFLAGFTFSMWGGILTGVIAGILMGPHMPTSIEYDLHDPFASWFLRLVMFSLIGCFAGVGAFFFKSYIKELEIKHTLDPLTELPNLNGLTKIFLELTSSSPAVTVIVIEVFHMQEINTAIGSEGVSTLIKQVSAHLKEVTGTDGILGYIQNNRFVILASQDNQYVNILKKCEALSDLSYQVNSIPLFVEMRFGISNFPKDDKSLDHLIRKALIAINLSAREAEHISYFNDNISLTSERNLMILHRAKEALANNSFVLEYQPKVFLKTEKIMGFEALIRWNDSLLGPVAPDEFIPLIEGTLLINPFTKWVVETSLSRMSAWYKEGILVPVSINFSIRNFLNPTLFKILEDKLSTQKFSPHFLEIEVTETAVTTSVSSIVEPIKKLRELGMKVLIDDFGTGQASQQYLFELPINGIKLDKVFVQSISHNKAAEAIVKNGISLAHQLNLEVTAEGVETRNQFNLLNQWGCDIAQGYYISRSMSAKKATKWLKERLELERSKKKTKLP